VFILIEFFEIIFSDLKLFTSKKKSKVPKKKRAKECKKKTREK
jgi:hypothetical protein